MLRIVKTPKIIKSGFPGLIWNIPNEENAIFLTFDDGPHPDITPWVLDVLEKHNLASTFFCLGKHAERYPHLVQLIKSKGHDLGNHGYDHLNGWKTKKSAYIKNVEQGRKVIQSKLYRPPYGKITPAQYSELKELQDIVMFDIIPYDFDCTVSPESCIENVIKNTKCGSIIVMHDSVKAWSNLNESLNEIIIQLKEKQFRFHKISDWL